ncbi:MAG: AzlC family ABC transporter permease [Rhizobiaceae bacterium]|nr:AzlC family ABC transporter permease [Rhizobiaceae bacterium]
MNGEAAPPSGQSDSHLTWYLRGFREVVSLPALILASSFVGFAALAQGAGFTLFEVVFMTATIWALPGMVVLAGAVIAGNSLFVVALAVALSSARLTPMVVSLVPEIRARQTRPWVLYLLSHFVAVTSWVVAMHKVRTIPRDYRTSWYGGVGSSLVILNMIVVSVFYLAARDLPPVLSAALLLLMPMYFLTSLWSSAREAASKVAMVLGLILGPVFAALIPELSLLVAGLAGGAAAYVWHRFRTGRAAP